MVSGQSSRLSPSSLVTCKVQSGEAPIALLKSVVALLIVSRVHRVPARAVLASVMMAVCQRAHESMSQVCSVRDQKWGGEGIWGTGENGNARPDFIPPKSRLCPCLSLLVRNKGGISHKGGRPSGERGKRRSARRVAVVWDLPASRIGSEDKRTVAHTRTARVDSSRLDDL